MKTIISARASRPFSWGAVFAGVAVGAVASIAVLSIGAFITFLFGLSFSLTGIMGLVWFAASAIVGAFVAGNIAVNAQAPTQEGNFAYQAVTEAHALLTGGVTAALLVLFTTFFTISGIGTIIGTTANVAGSVGSAVSSVIGGGVQSAALIGANGQFDLDKLPNLENQLAKIDEDKIAQVISDNNAELDQKQIKAIGSVIKDTLEKSKEDIKQDIDDIQLSNVDDYLKSRYEAAKKQLTNDELVKRLQAEGLSEEEAKNVQQYFVKQAEEIKQKAEKAVQKTKEALEEAEKAARSTARWAALSWLISALITFLAALAGARCAVGRSRKA